MRKEAHRAEARTNVQFRTCARPEAMISPSTAAGNVLNLAIDNVAPGFIQAHFAMSPFEDKSRVTRRIRRGFEQSEITSGRDGWTSPSHSQRPRGRSGVDFTTLRLWERNQTEPGLRQVPGVIRFLFGHGTA